MTDRKIIVVTGCRDWNSESAVYRELVNEIRGLTEAIMFHGACPTGADFLAATIAVDLNITAHAFPAQWGKHGRAAGPIRNGEMCEAAITMAKIAQCPVVCLAFWDGNSKGTLDCIKQATSLGISVRIVPRQS